MGRDQNCSTQRNPRHFHILYFSYTTQERDNLQDTLDGEQLKIYVSSIVAYAPGLHFQSPIRLDGTTTRIINHIGKLQNNTAHNMRV